MQITTSRDAFVPTHRLRVVLPDKEISVYVRLEPEGSAWSHDIWESGGDPDFRVSNGQWSAANGAVVRGAARLLSYDSRPAVAIQALEIPKVVPPMEPVQPNVTIEPQRLTKLVRKKPKEAQRDIDKPLEGSYSNAMNEIQQQIQARIQTFTTDLQGLIQQAAMQAVQTAVGSAFGESARPVKRAASTPAAKAAPAAKATSNGTGKRPRRNAEQIEEAANKVLSYVKAHAGERSEVVRANTSLEKPVFQLAVKHLIEGKKIKAKGERRATTFAVA